MTAVEKLEKRGFKIRKIKTRELLAAERMDGDDMLAEKLRLTVSKLDGTPAFSSIEQIAEADWYDISPMHAAYREINGLDEDLVEKK